MSDVLFAYEPYVRLAAFGGVFTVMAAWELIGPRRKQSVGRGWRWPNKLGIVALDTPVKVLEPQRLHDVFGVAVDVERDGAGGCVIRYRRPAARPAKLKLVAEAR